MARATIERERRRIEAAFCAALVAASAAAAAVEACGSGGGGGASSAPDASMADATSGEGGGLGDSALPGVDASADALVGAETGSCAPTFFILDGATLAQIDAGPDADLCALVEPCGLPSGITTEGCAVVETEQDGTPIPDSSFGCAVSVLEGCVNGTYMPPPGPSVELTCACELFIQGGRRTGRARRDRDVAATTTLGGFFAAMAREEAASVAAFARLEAELLLHGAPRSLVRAARRAQRDEARHTEVMARLARARGGDARLGTPRRRVLRSRGLEAAATENAREGCVRETFAALLACWQAAHAEDAAIRAAFVGIARDETRHAALAWAVATWADGRLDPSARRRVARARRRAMRAVERSLGAPVHETLARGAGVARAKDARVLFAESMRALEGERRAVGARSDAARR